ncbi:MAG: PaaI family thioesterase [Methanomicrobiales archaeon]|nr:PaaI family thioesterase [Methanomicrobiales archaeon]
MGIEYLAALKERGRSANPFFMMAGIDIVAFGGGEAELVMNVTRQMLNGDGWLQGGMYVALCDEAMALALCTKLEAGESIATVSETTSFFRGVQEGTIHARGRVIRKGRRVAFTEGEVFLPDESNTLLAKTSASFALLR